MRAGLLVTFKKLKILQGKFSRSKMLLAAYILTFICLHFGWFWDFVLRFSIQMTIVLQVLRVNHKHSAVDAILDRVVSWPIDLFFWSKNGWETYRHEIFILLGLVIMTSLLLKSRRVQ
jgi:hypothetical protein